MLQMNERLNKTSICTVIFLDIVGYSKCTDAEQILQKKHFNRLINDSIKSLAQNDRILLDTGDGAAIALLGAPEEALFIAMAIRDSICEMNKLLGDPLLVRIGINLGPVRVVKDINGRPNIIGDGINVAQRVMSFAEPNQILVSRSYYEITSRLSKEITELFTYSGVKHDKHVREHEVYAIGVSQYPNRETTNPGDDSGASELHGVEMIEKGNGWWSIAAALTVLLALTFTISSGVLVSDTTPENMEAKEETEANTTETSEQLTFPAEAIAQEPSFEEATMRGNPDQFNAEPEPGSIEQAKVQIVTANVSAKSGNIQKTEKSTWESFKESVRQGNTKKPSCSDAERSLKQCE